MCVCAVAVMQVLSHVGPIVACLLYINTKKWKKKLPGLGIELGPLDHKTTALPIALPVLIVNHRYTMHYIDISKRAQLHIDNTI